MALQPFSVIVLAAGGSSRLGQAKQLLPYGNSTLIQHAVNTAVNSGAAELIVVVGAHRHEVSAALAGLPVKVVPNELWQEGMASSIRAGIGAVSQPSEAAVIMVCDQPRITAAHLRSLAEGVLSHEAPLAASCYDGTLGVPCAFGRSTFSKLIDLKGDVGARAIIRSATSVKAVPFELGNLDIDTAKDLERLVEQSHTP